MSIPVALALAFSQAQASPPVAGPVAGDAMVEELERADAALFEAGFDTCDVDVMARLIAEDLEFYHDKDGLAFASRDAFLAGFSCRDNGPDGPVFARRLVPGTLAVYPIGDDYALQTGRHVFFEVRTDGPDIMREAAQFAHLWRRVAGGWELVRIISYDHRVPGEDTLP